MINIIIKTLINNPLIVMNMVKLMKLNVFIVIHLQNNQHDIPKQPIFSSQYQCTIPQTKLY